MSFFDSKFIVKMFGQCNKENITAKNMYKSNIVVFFIFVLITIYDFYYMMTTTGFSFLNLFRELGFLALLYGILRVSYNKMWINRR